MASPEMCMVVVMRVDRPMEVVRIKNHFEEFQKLVGGPFDVVDLGRGLGVYCNDEGLFDENAKINLAMPNHHPLVGDLVISKCDADGDTIDLSPCDIRLIQKYVECHRIMGDEVRTKMPQPQIHILFLEDQ